MNEYKCIKNLQVGDYTLKVNQIWFGDEGDNTVYLEHENKRIFLSKEDLQEVFIKI